MDKPKTTRIATESTVHAQNTKRNANHDCDVIEVENRLKMPFSLRVQCNVHITNGASKIPKTRILIRNQLVIN